MEKEIKTILKFYKPYLKYVGLVGLFLIGKVGSELSLPALMAKIIDKGILPGDLAYIYKTGLLMLLTTVIAGLFTVGVGYYSAKVAAGVCADIRESIFKKVSTFGPYEIGRFSTASLITRSTGDIQQIQQVTSMFLRMAILAPLMGFGALIQAMRTSVGLSSVILVSLIAVTGVIVILFITTVPKFDLTQKIVDRMNLIVNERLTGVQVIRAFGTEQREEDRFEEANSEYRWLGRFIGRSMSTMMPALYFIMEVTTLAVVWVGSKLVISGDVEVGQIPAFIQYTALVILSFIFLTVVFIMIPRAAVSMKRIGEVLNTMPLVNNTKAIDTLETYADTEESKQNIPVLSFKDVSFSYPGSHEKAISNISFDVNKGEQVAIIGSTGSGKSTILNLIPRFYNKTSGEILINGQPIDKIDLGQLRSKVSTVLQTADLFSGTVRENLALGLISQNSNLTDEEISDRVNKALEIAQAKDFIYEYPFEDGKDYLDKTISQGGTNFSGGQRQRLSIARALTKDWDILLLDDSFSALDFTTDKKLREALEKEYYNKAILLVAQRINSVMSSDKILVLEEGKIVGAGTHDYLMSNCHVYKEIAISQLDIDEDSSSSNLESSSSSKCV